MAWISASSCPGAQPAINKLGLHRLEAACLPDNAASQGLLRKLGFHEEGYARDYLRINGQWQDHLLFAMLSGDYFAAVR